MEVVFVPSSCSSSLLLLLHCLRLRLNHMEDSNPLQKEESHNVSKMQLRAIPSTANVRPPEHLPPVGCNVQFPMMGWYPFSTSQLINWTLLFSDVFSCKMTTVLDKNEETHDVFLASSTATSISSWMQHLPQEFLGLCQKIHGKNIQI